MKPLGNQIICEYVKENKTKGGVILSNVSQKKPEKGIVAAVGPGRMDRYGNFIKPQVKKGDIVMFSPYIPKVLTINGKEYLIMEEEDIYCIL